MSIIIHFNPTPFIPSTGTIKSSCIKASATKLEMAPGIKHDTDEPVMMDDSSVVDLATSNTLYGRVKDGKVTNHTTQSLGCCFGLPYQDHNYGAPPPPTPPSYSPCASPAHVNGIPDDDTSVSVVSISTLNEDTHEGSITRCVCGFEHDDEYMICCDRCLVWQHVDCMGLDRNNIPETYMCEKCQPRKVDRHKAKVLQTRKKVAMTDSSDSDEDNKNSERRPKTRSKTSRKKKEDEKTDDKSENNPVKRSRSGKNSKERMEIKRTKLRRNKNKESTSTADEEAQDAWEYSIELCDKNFEAATNNQYTPEVQLIARTLQKKGEEIKSIEQLQVQLCQVEEIESNKKRLYSICDIPRGQPIIEYKGKFLLTSQFYELHPLFNKRLYPYVLFHSFLQEEICVDASFYGNDARFLRRSCKPNAEVRHATFNGNLHLYISSTKAIFKDEEITIPFDYCQKNRNKDVDCACEREYCVLRHSKRNGDAEICKRRTRQFTSSADDDSSHSLAGLTNSPMKSKQSPVKSSLNQVSPVQSSLTEQMDTKGTSDQEPEEHPIERRRKMTREERKIDAIMRAFDQMEKAAKRRQQALDRLAQQQKSQHPKSEEVIEKPEVIPSPVKEEEKPPVVSGSEMSCVEEEKEKEKVSALTPATRTKRGKRRRGSGTQIRRRTRTNSGGSDILSPDDALQQVPNNVMLTPTPIPVPIQSLESNTDVMPAVVATNPPASSTDSDIPESPPPPPVVLKTKREWMHEKSESTASTPSPCSIQTEVSWSDNTDAPTCYVRCTKDGPNVVGISAAHLRRSSSSGQLRPSTGQGSAKKRWLRQAMYDCNTLEELSIVDPSSMETIPSPLHNGCLSPNSHGDANSPGTSDDIVTPLKKRRLMRESVESMPSPRSPASIQACLDSTTSSSSATNLSSSDFKADLVLNEKADSNESIEEIEKMESIEIKKEDIPIKVNGLRDSFAEILGVRCKNEEEDLEKTNRAAKGCRTKPLQQSLVSIGADVLTPTKDFELDFQKSIEERKVEPKLEKVESKLEKVESKLEKVESKLEKVESKLEKVELKSEIDVILDNDKLKTEKGTNFKSENNTFDDVKENKNVDCSQKNYESKVNEGLGSLRDTSANLKSDILSQCTEFKDFKLNVCKTESKFENMEQCLTTEHEAKTSSVDSAPSLATANLGDSDSCTKETSVEECDDVIMTDCTSPISRDGITSLCKDKSDVKVKPSESSSIMNAKVVSNDATESSIVSGLEQCSISSVSSTSAENLPVSTSEVPNSVSDVVASAMSEVPESSSSSSSSTVNSSNSLDSLQFNSISNAVGSVVSSSPTKPVNLESNAECTLPMSVSAVTTSSVCASATQKRKVSLSEYRLRMKDGTSKVRPTNENQQKKPTPSISATISLSSPTEQISLAPLLLNETRVSETPPAQPSSKKDSKSKNVVPVDDDEESDTSEHHRENLTERLRREFGLEDDIVEEGSAIPVVVSQPTQKSGGILSNKAMPIPSLCSQPPPPPPPPPPRLARAPQVLTVPTSPQFNYAISPPFPRPPYMVPQVPYISPQTQLPIHHQMTQASPHPMLTMVPYTPPIPNSALRQPSRSDYASVNAQSFVTLVQQPPPPPNPGYHMYQPGFFK